VVTAAWRLGNGNIWRIYINFSDKNLTVTPSWENARLIFNYGVHKTKYEIGQLPAKSILVSTEDKSA